MNFTDRLRIIKHRLIPSKYGFKGNFTSWDKASQKSVGYDSTLIIEKVKSATLRVINGQVAYERDSMVFDEIEYSWPLLASLLWIGNQNKSNLKVIDFGGSLGSTYYQNKQFLKSLNNLEWNIIEQRKLVEIGREINKDQRLQFFYDVEEAINSKGIADVIILSCTLPYIKDPHSLLNKLISLKTKYIILDNTFYNYLEKDRICIQNVLPAIYKGSYPCWLLSYKRIVEIVKQKYNIVAEYKNESFMFLDGRKIQYRGLIAKLNENEA